MRVLHVTAGNLYGGIETMLVTLARYRESVPEMDTQFGVCFDGRLRDELEARGARVHSLGQVRASRPLSVRRARRRLAHILSLERIDIVVCHSAWPMAIFGPAAVSAGCRLVLWQHGPIDGVRWLERWARRSTPALVITNSSYTASLLEGIFAPIRVEVLFYPVAEPESTGESLDALRIRVRNLMGVGSNEVVIVQASRLEAWKGHLLHLEALARLREVPGWRCWMIGGPQRPCEANYLRQLRDRTESLGISDHVQFLGQRADVPELLAGADVLCQPNTGPEPFGITFVEALWAGLPVVTTAMGGAIEIFDESCGILAERAEAAEVAEALQRLIVDPVLRNRPRTCGPSRANELCNPVQQLQRLHIALRNEEIQSSSLAKTVVAVKLAADELSQ